MVTGKKKSHVLLIAIMCLGILSVLGCAKGRNLFSSAFSANQCFANDQFETALARYQFLLENLGWPVSLVKECECLLS